MIINSTFRTMSFAALSAASLGAATLLAATNAHATWPQALGSLGKDNVVVVKTAPSGDLYVAGNFNGSMDIGGTTLISQGLQDVFVARLSASGGVIWARSAGGASVDVVRDIALDATNNIYLVGDYFANASFGGNSIGSGAQNYDGYIAKINTLGAWQWARTVGGGGNDRATGVVTAPGDSSQIPPIPESAVVVGAYFCSATFGGPVTRSLGNGRCGFGNTDLFAARITASGDWVWARDRGGSASGYDAASHIAIDSDNRIYVVGQQPAGGLQTAFADDFNAATLSPNWIPSNAAVAGVVGASNFWFGNNHLALRNEANNVMTVPINLSGVRAAVVSMDILRGLDFLFSEDPDPGEDFYVQYLDATGVWQNLEGFSGGGLDGEHIVRTGASAYTLNANAFHANFRLRFLLTGGSGSCCDWWHVDNVQIQIVGTDEPFLFNISNVISANPTLNPPTVLPAVFKVNGMALDGSVTNDRRLLLHGTRTATINTTCGQVAGTGAFAMSLTAGAAAPVCVWAKGAAGGEGNGVASDGNGNVYLTGAFTGATTFFSGTGGTLNAQGSSADVFIASLSRDGNWRWATGGRDLNTVTGIPARAGGGGTDRGLAITTDGVATVWKLPPT
jgi:hypothetical protein